MEAFIWMSNLPPRVAQVKCSGVDGVLALFCMGEKESDLCRESDLVTRLRAGDPAAYETLVRDAGPRMLAVARRFLHQEEDACDAVQESFVAAFTSIDRFSAGSQLTTWLHRIVVNAALMRLRSQRRKPESLIDELLPTYFEDGHRRDPRGPWTESVEELHERGELRALVRAAIEKLPETYRTVLLLRDIEELETQAVARLLGISGNAVKVRLHRARQALRGLLDPQLGGVMP